MPRVYEGDRDYIAVSYARADGEVARTIIDALSDAGYRVWFDGEIEPGTKYPDRIADRVHDCACVVMLVSSSSVASGWCRQEVDYALELKKPILPVYLEDVELPRALQMRLGTVQALRWHEYDTDEGFNEALFKVPMLRPCLTVEGKRRTGVKPRGDQATTSAETNMAATVTDATGGGSASTADRSGDDDEVVRSGRRREYHWPRWLVPSSISKAAIALAVAFVLASLAPRACSQIGSIFPPPDDATAGDTRTSDSGTADDNTGNVSDDPKYSIYVIDRAVDDSVTVPGVPVRDKLDDYNWNELKSLSRAIASAMHNREWQAIAKRYNLVDADGKLQGDTKSFTFDDGRKTSIRILGFRHDELEGGGRSGITFEFADIPETHVMNKELSNVGGWEASDMREWLNGEFLSGLPRGLRSCIESVMKRTNNTGMVESEDDTTVVTTTADKLWLLSLSEVFGTVSGEWSAATYDAEGTQYQLYADQGVTVENYGFCAKDGASSWWWLRSPLALGSVGFRLVLFDGDWRTLYAGFDWGVSPGFCF